MANKDIVQETFPVLGMSCASCSARVEKTLNHQPGVRKAVVNYASAMATVEYDLQNCSPETLQQAVQAAGYDLLIKQDENMPDEVEQAHDKKYRALKFRTTWAIALSVPVMLIGMFFMDMPYANPVMWLLSTPIVFWLGRGFFASAWKQLKHGSANMDTLVANSTGIAYLFSLFNMPFPCKRHHHLYPAGTPAGGKGQRKHFLRNQETHGAATQNSYSHHRFFVGKDCPD